MTRFPLLLSLPLLGSLLAQAPQRPSVAPVPPTPPVAASFADAAPDRVLFDRPRAEGPLWAMGRTWKGSFDATGFTFVPYFDAQAPRNFPLRVELATATLGGEPFVLGDGEPTADGTTVHIDRGGLTERFDLSLDAVEQSFVFATLPHRGALTVEVRLQGAFTTTATPGGLRFTNEHGSIDYRKALAIDAAGNQLALPITWTGTTAQLEIPAAFVAAAQLPLVLDPTLTVAPSLASGITPPQRNPDIATIENPTRSCVVWKRQFSAGDQDCWAVVVDDTMAAVTGVQAIDFSQESWEHVAVAGCQYGHNFLIVSQIDLGGQSWVGGRIFTTSGLTGLAIDIERGGVVGFPGMNYRPDVGADPFSFSGARYTVVWEHETGPGDRDIHYKQLRYDGTLVSTNPTLIAIDTRNETFPSIAKSCRAYGSADRWTVAWQRANFTFTDEDVVGAQIAPDGQLVHGPYPIATSTQVEALPQASSLALIDGAPYHAVVFQRLSAGQHDIVCQIVGDDGSLFATMNLSQSELFGIFQSRNQAFPSVDSDGVRFAIGYSEFSGSDYDTYVSTVAYLPAGNSLRIDDERVALGATPAADDYWTPICAEFSGGNIPSPRYFVAGAKIGTNDIVAWNYGGFVPGQYYGAFGSQCGNLPIAAAGIPAVGNRITFSLPTTNLSGFVIGFPAVLGLGVCNCVLGVTQGVTVPNPHSFVIPNSPGLVNSFTLSVQGWAFGGSACLGAIDLSNTLDFVIR